MIELKSTAMILRFALIDAPSPLGVGPTGVERLAEALRAAGLKEALKAEDGGAVRVPPHDPRRDPDTLLLNPSPIRDFLAATRRLARRRPRPWSLPSRSWGRLQYPNRRYAGPASPGQIRTVLPGRARGLLPT